MILGIGTDLSEIARHADMDPRLGVRLRARVFTEGERARAESRPDPAASYAARWAAKEACLKALGMGQCEGVAWRDIEITSDPSGRPGLTLHGPAAARLAELAPRGHSATAHLSMSHDAGWALAFVVLEARAEQQQDAA